MLLVKVYSKCPLDHKMSFTTKFTVESHGGDRDSLRLRVTVAASGPALGLHRDCITDLHHWTASLGLHFWDCITDRLGLSHGHGGLRADGGSSYVSRCQ